ncbi:MAG: DUF2779 domain-containing protein [Gemmatimonadaceae bacterium]
MTAAPASNRTLSKSDFTLARTCDAKLYFRENGYPDNRESDEYLRLLGEGGYMVEALAVATHPEGIMLEYGRDPVEDCRRTLAHLSRDSVTLFQATLLHGRRLARVDIVEKKGDVVRLLEVKAKSFDGEEHLAKLASGGKGVFRGNRKPHAISKDWRAKLEDITYQMLLLEHLLPHVMVQPFLVLVDRSKRSALDSPPRLFRLERREGRDGRQHLHTAHFVGDAEHLAHLDLLTEVDVSAEVAMLRDEVEASAARYEAMLDSPYDPSMSVRGAKCRECEFRPHDPSVRSGFAHCWGELAYCTPHVLDLHSIGQVRAADGTPLVESLVRNGKASLLDIPEDRLAKKDGSIGPQAERQLRQMQCVRSGEAWMGPGLAAKVESLAYPLHFIDFEVSRLALPYHARMRPYGQVVFQWSCHTVRSQGEATAPSHSEWLNTADTWPNHEFVVALRSAIGDDGTVLTWSHFEISTLREIVRELADFGEENPDLVEWIRDLVERRIVDLHDWAKNDYLHPGMRGRTSIKVVLDALWKSDPVMREQFAEWTGLQVHESADPYTALPALEINGVPQDVHEGTGAVRAYQAMMYGVERDDEEARDAWCELLRQYCRLDTLSMMLVFEHWRRATA